ncbi:phosphopantetheine-binding protein [Streptomyces sp. TRM 70361]|uniref:acyl carrier protein n=1 Tax=Streptomyces sp. TRM 70361 TaxID=3116553 RepID=UPI002E7AC26C|nr:phosphopantetheine-binding protein [Streptomyces sp. TRM 70361]MEE1943030.1 phosphopantetheine-binding protein [Streptomyces sp. TRM 70361]
MITKLDYGTVAESVKHVVIAESRLSLAPADINDHEPLNGEVLSVNSLGFVGMLVRLEDELDVMLSDDLFVGRTFHTVDDLVKAVLSAAEASR